jgi:predicted nucleic acid-binding protein
VRCVVSDTGPLLHLTEAQALHLLQWVGDLHAPPQVVAEMTYHLSDWHVPEWMTLDVLVAPHASDASAWQQTGLLDAGEAEAIALARQINADWLLTDDAAARLFAEELGLEVHGSLGVVLWVAALGHIDRVQAEQALSGLAASSLWISRRVLAEARAALDEVFR